MIGKVVHGFLTLFLPFSLTKYSAIFVEVKGYFGINNNQLGGVKFVEIWSKLCSLQDWFNNKLEKEVAIRYCDNCWVFEVATQQKTSNNQLKWNVVIAGASLTQKSKRLGFSSCRFDWCVGAIVPFKTGGSKRFEVIGIKSTIKPHPWSPLLKIVGAGCAPSERKATPSEANVSFNLKELLQMVAGVTWWSVAWITRQNFTWIIWWSFAWIPWWIAQWNFTWIAWWSLVTWCSPSETEIRSTVVWAVKAFWMNATIRWSLELAGSFQKKSARDSVHGSPS